MNKVIPFILAIAISLPILASWLLGVPLLVSWIFDLNFYIVATMWLFLMYVDRVIRIYMLSKELKKYTGKFGGE